MIEKDLINSIKDPDGQLALEAQAGDVTAEETIIRKYSGIVTSKAKAYFMAGADENDVMQEGFIGLLRAVRKYDPTKKASFATFAEICVTRQIIDAIRSADRVKHKALNTSISLNKPLFGGDYGTQQTSAGEAGNSAVTLGDTLKAGVDQSPEEMVVIRDVAYYILNNGDNIFSDFEIQVLSELTKGYSKDQIAAKLNKSRKSIENALNRTRRKVIDYLWE